MANIMDLLKDTKHTTYVNENISKLYMFYQAVLFVSTILGPGTILLTIASALRTVFSTLTIAESYVISILPAFFYIVICLKTKASTQIAIGAVMTGTAHSRSTRHCIIVRFIAAIYALVMSMVLVATAAQIVKSGLLDPSAVFLPSVALIFIVTGILHPNEIANLLHGFLYLITIPGGYLLLVTYALCNLHVVSWGTRETVEVVKKKKPNSNQAATEKEVVKMGKRNANEKGARCNEWMDELRSDEEASDSCDQQHVLGRWPTAAWFPPSSRRCDRTCLSTNYETAGDAPATDHHQTRSR